MDSKVTNYVNLLTLALGIADFRVHIGQATVDGVPSVVWIAVDSLTATATMNCLVFDATFLAQYGSNHTVKFATYGTTKQIILLMDNNSGGLPLLVSITYSTRINEGTVTKLFNTISFASKTVLTASDLFYNATGKISFMVKDTTVTPP